MVKPPPDQYMFEGDGDKGVITQFEKQEGRTSFLAGVNGMGSAQERMEDMQAFDAQIAVQVARACNARFLDDTGFLCTPERGRCREALQSQTMK